MAKKVRKTVGVVIFDTNGKLLICKRSQNKAREKGKWQLVQGGLENFDINHVEAVYREVAEEVGIEKEALGIPQALERIDYNTERKKVTIYWHLTQWKTSDLSTIVLDKEETPEFDEAILDEWDFLIENCPCHKKEMYIKLRCTAEQRIREIIAK